MRTTDILTCFQVMLVSECRCIGIERSQKLVRGDSIMLKSSLHKLRKCIAPSRRRLQINTDQRVTLPIGCLASDVEVSFGGLLNLPGRSGPQYPNHRKCAFLSVDANARAALLATCVPFCRSVLELIQIDTRSSASTKKLAIAVFKSLSAGKISLSNTRPTGFGRVRGHISAPRAEKNYVRFS